MSKHAWKINLIPWDHTSPEQVHRMFDQRVACGWRSDEVGMYVESAKQGKRIFYWLVLSEAVPDREKVLEAHFKAYPKETDPLRDTAKEIRLLPRQPNNREFHPIGHVALDIHPAAEDAKLGLPATETQGIVWVHQLYVSWAIQGGGFGAGAMAQAEKVASEGPMAAKLMVLDTIAKESAFSEEGKKAIFLDKGVPIPTISTEEWYERLGYEVFKRQDSGYTLPSENGEGVPLAIVIMKKPVA